MIECWQFAHSTTSRSHRPSRRVPIIMAIIVLVVIFFLLYLLLE